MSRIATKKHGQIEASTRAVGCNHGFYAVVVDSSGKTLWESVEVFPFEARAQEHANSRLLTFKPAGLR